MLSSIKNNTFMGSKCDPVDELYAKILQTVVDEYPDLTVTGAFYVSQTTQFPDTEHRYFNKYLIFRIENSFGGCCIEQNQIDIREAELLSGRKVLDLLQHESLAVRVTCLDALLGHLYPMDNNPNADIHYLPFGNPLQRAKVRDNAIAESLMNLNKDEKVLLIGVVNPLVDAITSKGAICLPCDYNMQSTLSGLSVSKEMTPLLKRADRIITTGMTIGNGSFAEIFNTAKERNIPLTVYSQTGANIFARIIGNPLNSLIAESFPFSQFTAQKSPFYVFHT